VDSSLQRFLWRRMEHPFFRMIRANSFGLRWLPDYAYGSGGLRVMGWMLGGARDSEDTHERAEHDESSGHV